MEKYCKAGHVTDDNTIWRMHIACWLQTHTQNMYYLLLFHNNSGYTNAPRCYVIRASAVLSLCQCGFFEVGTGPKYNTDDD